MSASPRPSPTWWQPNHLWDQRWSTAWSALASLRRAQSLPTCKRLKCVPCLFHGVLSLQHISLSYLYRYIYIYSTNILHTTCGMILGKVETDKIHSSFPSSRPSSCPPKKTHWELQLRHSQWTPSKASIFHNGKGVPGSGRRAVFHPKPSKKNNG